MFRRRYSDSISSISNEIGVYENSKMNSRRHDTVRTDLMAAFGVKTKSDVKKTNSINKGEKHLFDWFDNPQDNSESRPSTGLSTPNKVENFPINNNKISSVENKINFNDTRSKSKSESNFYEKIVSSKSTSNSNLQNTTNSRKNSIEEISKVNNEINFKEKSLVKTDKEELSSVVQNLKNESKEDLTNKTDSNSDTDDEYHSDSFSSESSDSNDDKKSVSNGSNSSRKFLLTKDRKVDYNSSSDHDSISSSSFSDDETNKSENEINNKDIKSSKEETSNSEDETNNRDTKNPKDNFSLASTHNRIKKLNKSEENLNKLGTDSVNSLEIRRHKSDETLNRFTSDSTNSLDKTEEVEDLQKYKPLPSIITYSSTDKRIQQGYVTYCYLFI